MLDHKRISKLGVGQLLHVLLPHLVLPREI